MEELGPVIIVIAYVLLMLVSKLMKKGPAQPRPRAQQRRVPIAEPRSDVAEIERAPKRSLAEELLSMLQEQAEPKPVPAQQLPEVDDEAESLELLEFDEQERHDRFREQYVVPAETPYVAENVSERRPYAVERAEDRDAYAVEEVVSPEPYSVEHTRRRRKNLTRSELRHAFIMREVLGPPKALEE